MFIYFGGYIMSVAIASGGGPGDAHRAGRAEGQ
jgi:hypothetical protein